MRKAKLRRTTTETDIRASLNLDGQGRAKISTGIPFLDHMLTLVARHGAMDLELTARGDLEVDQHHTVEDTGIVLGETVRKALGSKRGILRCRWTKPSRPRRSTSAGVRISYANGNSRRSTLADYKQNCSRISSAASRKPPARTFTFACCTAGHRTIRWRQSSKRSPGRCVLRPRAIHN